MSPVSRDPLTPEERALAARLSRIGPHGEPPAALDARILSAAHAAHATAPTRHRRWPALLGVAATLALAVGISWQMRPRPEAAPALEEGPAAAAPVAAPHAEAADAAAAMPSAPTSAAEAQAQAKAEATGSAPQPQPRMAPPLTARSKVPAPKEPPLIVESVEAQDEPPMELAPAMAPAPAPAPAAASAPPAPPPPRATPEPTAAPMSEAAASDRAAATGAAKAAQRSASPQPVAVDSLEVGGVPRIGSRAARDVPIQEDARLSAADWLDRIRLRQAADDIEGARASLALFHRYYPDHAIPQDLVPLAQ